MPTIRRCCIVGCNSNSRQHPQLQFFQFPKPENPFHELWKQACHTSLSRILPFKKPVLCALHFLPKCLGGRRLTATAVPTLHLDAPTNLKVEEKTAIEDIERQQKRAYINDVVYEWLMRANLNLQLRGSITHGMIKEKAEIAKQLIGSTDFVADNRWLNRFRETHLANFAHKLAMNKLTPIGTSLHIPDIVNELRSRFPPTVGLERDQNLENLPEKCIDFMQQYGEFDIDETSNQSHQQSDYFTSHQQNQYCRNLQQEQPQQQKQQQSNRFCSTTTHLKEKESMSRAQSRQKRDNNNIKSTTSLRCSKRTNQWTRESIRSPLQQQPIQKRNNSSFSSESEAKRIKVSQTYFQPIVRLPSKGNDNNVELEDLTDSPDECLQNDNNDADANVDATVNGTANQHSRSNINDNNVGNDDKCDHDDDDGSINNSDTGQQKLDIEPNSKSKTKSVKEYAANIALPVENCYKDAIEVTSYDKALKHLTILENFALNREDFIAINLLSHLSSHYELCWKTANHKKSWFMD